MAVGERAVLPLLVQEAVVALAVSKSVCAALSPVAAIAWAARPCRHLGEPRVGIAALAAALGSLPGGAAAACKWPVESRFGARCHRGVGFCCWPILRLALKRQHTAVLRGAPRLPWALEGAVCLWLHSKLERDQPVELDDHGCSPNGELESRANLLAVVSGGGLLLLRHRLATLDPGQEAMDGMEHAPQAVLAPDWPKLAAFLSRVAPRWLAEVEDATGIARQSQQGATLPAPVRVDDAEDSSSDDDSVLWTSSGEAPWVEILCPEPLFEAVDALLQRKVLASDLPQAA